MIIQYNITNINKVKTYFSSYFKYFHSNSILNGNVTYLNNGSFYHKLVFYFIFFIFFP